MGFFQKKFVGLSGICQKQERECQKFSFWQDGNIFGRIFGRCLMIEMAEMPRNKGIQGLYGECQKFNFWQDRECFWHFGRDFWQITDVIISGKPINRAFHWYLWNAKNFGFGRSGDVFGRIFGIVVLGVSQNLCK